MALQFGPLPLDGADDAGQLVVGHQCAGSRALVLELVGTVTQDFGRSSGQVYLGLFDRFLVHKLDLQFGQIQQVAMLS